MKKGDVVSLADHKQKKESKQASNTALAERAARMQTSINKIHSLMAELKAMRPHNDNPTINKEENQLNSKANYNFKVDKGPRGAKIRAIHNDTGETVGEMSLHNLHRKYLQVGKVRVKHPHHKNDLETQMYTHGLKTFGKRNDPHHKDYYKRKSESTINKEENQLNPKAKAANFKIYGEMLKRKNKKKLQPDTTTHEDFGYESDPHPADPEKPLAPAPKKGLRSFLKAEDLNKGKRGDWQQESNNYKFHHSYTDDDPEYGGESHYVTVTYGPTNKQHDLSKPIGNFMFRVGEEGEWTPAVAEVSPKHRRKGIASHAYNIVESKLEGDKLIPYHDQTKDARALWSNPNRQFGKAEDLNKGKRGDWSKEGYTFEHHKPTDNHPRKSHEIHAWDKAGDYAGVIHFNEGDNDLHTDDIRIHPNHKRKGLASQMYAMGEKYTGKKFYPSDVQTDEGEALWAQKNRPFGKAEVEFLEFAVTLLEKRSKNVREQTRNITSEQAENRRARYARKLGLDPVRITNNLADHIDFPTDTATTKESPGSTLPYNDQFGVEHETAHAMATPKGMTAKDYFKRLGDRGGARSNKGWDMSEDYENQVDESIANATESIIDRRAGVGGFASKFRNRIALSNTLGESKVDPDDEDTPHGDAFEDKYHDDYPSPKYKSNLSTDQRNQRNLAPFKPEAKMIVDQFDQGAKFNNQGEIEQSDSIHAKINARAKLRSLKKTDQIPGGLADKKKPSDFPKDLLDQGIKVEMEHTSSRAIATEIAMDHLTEDINYYKKLKTIEKS